MEQPHGEEAAGLVRHALLKGPLDKLCTAGGRRRGQTLRKVQAQAPLTGRCWLGRGASGAAGPGREERGGQEQCCSDGKILYSHCADARGAAPAASSPMHGLPACPLGSRAVQSPHLRISNRGVSGPDGSGRRACCPPRKTALFLRRRPLASCTSTPAVGRMQPLHPKQSPREV